VEKSLEVGGHRSRTVATRERACARNGEKAHQSVNAITPERGDAVTAWFELPRRGTLRRVFATGDDSRMDR
jgi:hypothetical protein